MPDQVVRFYQSVLTMPPAASVFLMLVGAIVFISNLRSSHHARAMQSKHVWGVSLGLVLFFLGFFPILYRMPQVWPRMQ